MKRMRTKIVLITFLQYVIFVSIGCVPSSRKLPKELREVSGVARTTNGNTYWINDGGNDALLFSDAIPRENVKSIPVDIPNVDWEALSSYRDSLLCICDIGDNRQKRDDVVVTVINTKGDVLTSRKLQYPQGPTNAEACSVKKEKLYILTKTRLKKNGAAKLHSKTTFVKTRSKNEK